jgi:hypothetical protein
MSVIEDILAAIDKLNPDEQYKVYTYLKQKQQTMWWTVSPNNLQKIDNALRSLHEEAAQLSEDEINALIDEVIDEVRYERKEDTIEK